MTQVKENSTRNANKDLSELNCPVTYVMNRIGGHWKPIILYHLTGGPKRYSELRRSIPAITEKMLIQHLKQLQDDGLVRRKAVEIVPPHVVYSLSKSGKSLQPILQAMTEWARSENKQFCKVK